MGDIKRFVEAGRTKVVIDLLRRKEYDFEAAKSVVEALTSQFQVGRRTNGKSGAKAVNQKWGCGAADDGLNLYLSWFEGRYPKKFEALGRVGFQIIPESVAEWIVTHLVMRPSKTGKVCSKTGKRRPLVAGTCNTYVKHVEYHYNKQLSKSVTAEDGTVTRPGKDDT